MIRHEKLYKTMHDETEIAWKKLDANIQVGSFPSCNPPGEFGPSRIYVKRYSALKNENKKQSTTVFLLHDLGQHQGRFQSFITWMREHNPGTSFIAMDFVGHGLSSGTRGHFEKLDYLVRDVHFLISQMNKSSGESWIILGHGMGGLVALDLVNSYQDTSADKIDGLILSNFIMKISSTFMAIENQFNFNASPFSKMYSHSRPTHFLKGHECLSLPADSLQLDQDPLVVHRPTLNSLKELQKKMTNIYQDSYFLGKRLLIMKSDARSIHSSSGQEFFAKGIKKDLLTEKKYSLMKHDLYNERDREIVFKDIASWMNAHEI
jgi:alpha-beta hydrolase superfamily lysophospholipase